MKGLIICGYPGIGKSSIAGWNNCIDLESSWFSRSEDDQPIPDEEWVKRYCGMARNLAMQGFTVLVSTHEAVIKEFDRILCSVRFHGYAVVIFCPSTDMKERWSYRLLRRYLKDGDMHPDAAKNLRALVGAIEFFDFKIKKLINSKMNVYHPSDLNYDLREEIIKIRKKEGCYSDISKADSPLESMAGVEESGLDVPVVEKDPDIPGDQP